MTLPRLLLASVVSAAVALAAAACTKSDTSPTTTSTSSNCSVTLGGATTSVSAAATSGSIAVTAASTCAWTAASSASFLTVTSGATGTGNGSVGYSIAANSGASRSGSIVVNGTAVVFTQAAQQVTAPTGCTVKLDTTLAKVNSGGGNINVAVTADSNCAWNATSNSSFLTAQLNATGNGTVVITASANTTSSTRSGTVTIGGQTVTITQDPGIFASFNLFDPAQTVGATNVCQIRGAPGSSTTCRLQSTSFTSGANAISTYQWTVQYTNTDVKVIASTSTVSSLSITDTCGSTQSTDDGALNPLSVTLTVTDSAGNTATAKSGSGNQPNLFVQLFNCGK